MLVTMKDVLLDAEKRQIAVGSFNAPNLATLHAILRAAEALSEPVILMHAQVHEEMGLCTMEEITPVLLRAAEKAKVPVCVHLDHGTDLGSVSDVNDFRRAALSEFTLGLGTRNIAGNHVTSVDASQLHCQLRTDLARRADDQDIFHCSIS